MAALLGWEIALIVIALLILAVIILFLVRWYIQSPIYRGTGRLDNKTVVITGGNTGIGLETARDLLGRGARVVILCRSQEKGRIAIEELKNEAESPNKLALYKLDLADFESIRECAKILNENEEKIDILINNAGVMMCPKLTTKDGFEMQFGTNHLGHFLFTLLLIEKLKNSTPCRIINVSSVAHTFGKIHWDDINLDKSYGAMKSYGQSKLANVLFTKSLAQKLKDTGITAYAVHPGPVKTELYRHLDASFGFLIDIGYKAINFMYKTPTQGAQTSIYCAVDSALENESGKYYDRCAEATPSRLARNSDDAERLWNLSLDLVGLKNFEI